LISAPSVTALAKKYQFKGHLGDQDFFTLLGLQHPRLIFKLPCSWNRQLCQWWREHGYADIFDRFLPARAKSSSTTETAIPKSQTDDFLVLSDHNKLGCKGECRAFF
jgi:hypothetical protein